MGAFVLFEKRHVYLIASVLDGLEAELLADLVLASQVGEHSTDMIAFYGKAMH